MYIRTKFDGGKQINRSQRGAWQGCCAGAGLRWNLGPSWGPPCCEKAVASAANDIFIQTAEAHGDTVARDKKRKASKTAKQQRKKAKQTSYLTDNSIHSRRSYSRHNNGPNAIEAPKTSHVTTCRILS